MTVSVFMGVPVIATGTAGFIGSHLVDVFLERSAGVRVLENFATGKRGNMAHCLERIELIEGDNCHADICHRVCEGVRLVLHLAALAPVPGSIKEPPAATSVKAGGTAKVVPGAGDTGVVRAGYVSSPSVYGDSTPLPQRAGEEGRPVLV